MPMGGRPEGHNITSYNEAWMNDWSCCDTGSRWRGACEHICFFSMSNIITSFTDAADVLFYSGINDSVLFLFIVEVWSCSLALRADWVTLWLINTHFYNGMQWKLWISFVAWQLAPEYPGSMGSYGLHSLVVKSKMDVIMAFLKSAVWLMHNQSSE